MSGRHTKLFGSTSYRTLGCPAHYRRGRDIPDPPSSDAAKEGSMLHGYAEEALKGGRPLDNYPWWEDLDDDQRNLLDTYVGLVRELSEGAKVFKVELFTQSPHLHAEWFGTADTVILKPPRLTVADLKCGRVPVGVYEYGSDTEPNPQLGSYAISLLENMKPENRALVSEVELIIVQPREGGVKRAVFTVAQLDRLKKRLLDKAHEAEGENPPAAVGPWCHFCKVKPVCETMRAVVMEQAKVDFAIEGGEPAALRRDALYEALQYADMAIEWGKSVKEYGERLLHAGDKLDGNWQLVPKRGHRVWTDPRKTENALLDLGLELEEIMVETLKSPAQIEALLRKKGLSLDLTDHVESVSTGLKIAKIDKGDYDADDDHGWV